LNIFYFEISFERLDEVDIVTAWYCFLVWLN